jgi:hypothetical protein
MESKRLDYNKSYKEIITHPHVRHFINSLEENYEISPFVLNYSRGALLVQLQGMIKQFEDIWNKSDSVRALCHRGQLPKMPYLFLMIKDLLEGFKDDEASFSLRSLLRRIQAIAESSLKPRFLQTRPPQTLRKFYGYLAKIDPDNNDSLNRQCEQLQNLGSAFLNLDVGQAFRGAIQAYRT